MTRQKTLQRIVFLTTLLLALGAVLTGTVLAQGPTPPAAAPVLSSQTQACITCHTLYTPVIVEDWRASRHSQKTPAAARRVAAAERRVSSDTSAEAMKSV